MFHHAGKKRCSLMKANNNVTEKGERSFLVGRYLQNLYSSRYATMYHARVKSFSVLIKLQRNSSKTIQKKHINVPFHLIVISWCTYNILLSVSLDMRKPIS